MDFSTCPPELHKYPPSRISLKDAKGAVTNIKKTSSATPYIGLGHRMAPNGCQTSKFNFRLGQCKELLHRIVPAAFTFKEAHLMIHTRIFPKVTYSMPITMFTKIQCKQLSTPIDQAMLPRLQSTAHYSMEALVFPKKWKQFSAKKGLYF